MQPAMSSAPGSRCQHCQARIPQNPGKGRPRRYCSARCRKAAHYARGRSWEYIKEQEPGLKLATVDEMYAAEHADPPPSPDHSTIDDVALTLRAAQEISREFRRHGVAAAPQLGWPCECVAKALDAALAQHFGDVL